MKKPHVCILQTSFAKRDDTVAFLKEKVPGVREATASHEQGTAKVILDGEVSDEALTKAVEAIGYIVDGVE